MSRKDSKQFRTKAGTVLSKMGVRVMHEKFINAVYSRNVPEINKFLERGVDPNYIHRDYGSASIHILAERNDAALAARLIESPNLNLNLKDNHGYSALHIAVMCNCRRFVVMLLVHGADPNIRDRFLQTPLHTAVLNQRYDIIKKLGERGAEVNVLDSSENTPLSLSILAAQSLEIAYLMFQFGANMSLEENRSLHIFFETVLHCKTTQQIDFVLLLLSQGVDVNLIEKTTGRNCLHFVGITGNLELAIVLVDKGADLNLKDNMQRFPSKVALEYENQMVADFFQKGYRPPNLLENLYLVRLWVNKVRQRVAERKRKSVAMGEEMFK